MTLYNGFLGFKDPKKEQTKVNNDLKEYWNGYNGKKGCKGKHCHKLRIDALRSCDKENICRITHFAQIWTIGDTNETYRVGAKVEKKSTDKNGLSEISHGATSKVSMYVGATLIEKMYVLANKQEISDVCFVDINGLKKCLFNSDKTKKTNIDSKYQVTFTNAKQNGAYM